MQGPDAPQVSVVGSAANRPDVLAVPKDNRIYRRELYHAYPTRIEREIWTLPDEWNTVLLFGHNPGYTELANDLRGEGTIDNVPTCGIVGARARIDDWSDFLLAEADRICFLYPKQTQ